MGRILTNNVSLAYSVEATFGVLNPSGEWKLLEPNDISTFGATITTVARNPISKTRQRRKGTVTDLDSAAEFEHDLTREVFIDFVEGFVFANFQGAITTRPTAVTTAQFTVPTMAAALLVDDLVFATGFPSATNNGLHVVDASPTTTAITVSTTLVADAAVAVAENATVEVCGHRASTGDLVLDVTAGVGTLDSTTLDFTTLGLSLGQLIHIGGLTASEQFSAGAGYGRITSISANEILLDKLSSTLATDPGTGETVDLLYGRFLKNVATDSADFIERSYQFEAVLANLGAGGATRYEYSLGNLANTMAISLPLADKAAITLGFIGTDTQVPTASRASGASTPTVTRQSSAFNTSADILRLRITKVDETGLTTCFKDVTLTLNNNVSPEKCLGTLGALFMNTGNFEVDLEGQILFTEEAVASAVRNNETVTMDILLKNDQGAISVDLPALTLGDGTKEFPVNESVLMSLSGSTFGDPILDTSIGISLFPVTP